MANVTSLRGRRRASSRSADKPPVAMLTPSNQEIREEERQRLLAKGARAPLAGRRVRHRSLQRVRPTVRATTAC